MVMKDINGGQSNLSLHKESIHHLVDLISNGVAVSYDPVEIISKARKRQEAINSICDKLEKIVNGGESLESDSAKNLLKALSKLNVDARELAVAITNEAFRNDVDIALMKIESAPMTRTVEESILSKLMMRKGGDVKFTSLGGAYTIRTGKK